MTSKGTQGNFTPRQGGGGGGNSQQRGGQPGGPPGPGSNRDEVVSRVVSHIAALNSFDKYEAAQMVKDAEEIASVISDDLKNSQMRRIYGMVKQLESERRAAGKHEDRDHNTRDALELLRPRLAYAAGRNFGVAPLRAILGAAIDAVNRQQDAERFDKSFRRFIDFFEAIVAYNTSRNRR